MAASVRKSRRPLSFHERQVIKKQIHKIYAELDALPLIVESATQLAREIELDAELTALKEELRNGRLEWPLDE
jgi:hypothetical protein